MVLKLSSVPATARGEQYSPIADEQWQKIAEAISGIAADIVMEITQNAMVMPGIPTAGGPINQVTVSPGKIS